VNASEHTPVLYRQALEWLAIQPDGIYVDATFGAGGHTRGILERCTRGRVIAFDADPAAIDRANALAASLESGATRFTFVHANFRELDRQLGALGVEQVDGVLFDLGVSSMQFNEVERGFSLQYRAPLDMRMNPLGGRSAYDVLTHASERELADIFFYYGQERAARRIARTIVQRREAGTLPSTTTDFAAMVSGMLQRSGHRERIHPATRVFQALRIAVNDELDALREGLTGAISRLRGAGRVVTISFHSLEDRIVKTTFREDERLDVLTRKPVIPDDAEILENPRARSAKLRAAQRKVNEHVRI
jgi:16S rRNA (cytosine1402-N4)-methyltransferase